MELDTSKWSGEGTFTALLAERLRTLDAIALVRVEDAPASRSEADYNFISNELFVAFTTRVRHEPVRRFGIPGIAGGIREGDDDDRARTGAGGPARHRCPRLF